MTDLRLHFVRHGESLANEADKAGRERPADWDGLSERGWEQARGLGRRLQDEGIEVIVAWTMRRAQETARGINEVLGLEIETDPDLHELKQSDAFYGSRGDFGDTASLNWMPAAPRDFAEPGAESFDAMLARVVRVRERMEARAGDERVLLVTHYGWLHFFLGHDAVRRRLRAGAPARRCGSPATRTRGSACSTGAPAGWTGWTSPGGA